MTDASTSGKPALVRKDTTNMQQAIIQHLQEYISESCRRADFSPYEMCAVLGQLAGTISHRVYVGINAQHEYCNIPHVPELEDELRRVVILNLEASYTEDQPYAETVRSMMLQHCAELDKARNPNHG